MRAGQAIALRLPVAARVVPPALPPGETCSGDVTIAARTVTGDVGPVLVDVQPGRPTFQDCLVTIGGVAGLEVSRVFSFSLAPNVERIFLLWLGSRKPLARLAIRSSLQTSVVLDTVQESDVLVYLCVHDRLMYVCACL